MTIDEDPLPLEKLDEEERRRCCWVGTGGGGIWRDARSTGEGELLLPDELWSMLLGIAEGGK